MLSTDAGKKNIFTSYKKYHRDVQSASYQILFLGRFLNAITENKVTYSLKIHTIDATTKMLVNLNLSDVDLEVEVTKIQISRSTSEIVFR